MPIQSFTAGDDTFNITAAGDRRLAFLGGEDRLTVNGGTSTTASMGDGNDDVDLRFGLATILGDAGDDRFDVRSSNATVDGGADNDLFNIRSGTSQLLVGGAGNDRFNFVAGVTAVFIDGSDGNDDFLGYRQTIDGSIHGGDGSDTFNGFIGSAVTLYGGTGNDLYRIDPVNQAPIIEYAGEGFDAIQLARGMSFVLPDNIEKISVSGFSGSTLGAATITGNASDNLVIAHNNDETINGLGGDDNIFGKGGVDTLNGGAGNDRLDGGAGNDVLTGDVGNDTLNGRAGDDFMDGGAGNDTYYVDSAGDIVFENIPSDTDTVRVSVDGYALPGNVEIGIVIGAIGLRLDGNGLDNTLTGGTGHDILIGWDGNDLVKGGAGNDQLMGMIGDDRLIGGVGADALYGHEGNDVLQGDDGSDALTGGAGADTLTGGADADNFIFTATSDSTGAAFDSITDFTTAADKLDLSAIDADTTVAGDQAFTLSFAMAASGTPHDLWFTSVSDGGSGYNFVWFGDVDGDGAADFEIHMHALSAISTTDIVY